MRIVRFCRTVFEGFDRFFCFTNRILYLERNALSNLANLLIILI